MTRWATMGIHGMKGPRRCSALVLAGALALSGCDALFGTSPEEYLSRGVDYYQEGDLASAAIEFRNVLQEEPDNARARYYLGVTELRTGDLGSALRDLERAQQLGHPKEQLALPLARVRLALGEFESVLEADAVEAMSQSEQAQWHYLRGRAALQLNERPRAEDEFRRALAADPGSADARYGQIVLARETGDADAIRLWIERTLRVDESHAGAWRTRAMLALQEGRHVEAEDAFDKAIANDNSPRASDLLRRGMLRLERNDLEGAKADARALRQRYSNAPWGPYLQGLTDLREGNRDTAQTAFDEALSRTDGFAAPRLFLAAIHGEEGRYDQAEYQLDRYEAATSESAVTGLMRVMLAFERGDADRGRTLLDEHIEEYPSDQRALAMRNYLAESENAEDGRFVRAAFSGLEAGGETSSRAAADAAESAGGEAPAVPQDAYDAVVQDMSAGNYGQALEQVEKLIEDYPDDSRLYNLKGGAHVARGDLQEAIEAFRDALQHDPANVSAVRNLGQLFERGNRHDVALALYQQAREHSPDALALILNEARLEARRGNDARGEALLDEAIEKHPEALEPRLLKARHFLSLGEPETTVNTLQPLRSQQSDNATYMRLLGEALLSSGRPDAASDALQRAAELGETDQELAALRARALVENEQYSEAEDLLRDEIEARGDALQLRILLVRLLSMRGDHDRAEDAYQALVERAGSGASVLAEGARAALRAGNTEQAIQRFREAQELQAGEDVTRGLARAHDRAGNPETARSILEEWLSERGLSAASPRLLHQLAGLRGRVDQDDPLPLYEHLLQRNPDDVLALNNLAWILRESEPKRALTLAERARELAPDSANIRHTLAMTLAENDRLSDAIAHLEELVEQASEQAYGLQMDLARLYIRADRPDDARPLLRRLASENDFAGASEAREQLEQL